MDMSEETLQRMEEEDPDVAFALRLQREEHMERHPEYYAEDGEEEEEVDVDEMTYEEMLELGERIGDVREERWRSRSQEFINKLPIVIYKKEKAASQERETPQKGVGATLESCLVCQCSYEDGDTLRRLPCNHHYHVDCIDQWLQMKNTCPVCKRSISTP